MQDKFKKLVENYSKQKLPKFEKINEDQILPELISIIISQQISTKAAASIKLKLRSALGEFTLNNLSKYKAEDLIIHGLSRQKASYIESIISSVRDGSVKLDQLNELSDEEVIIELVKLKGIGRWSAEMFLIFSLAREDVFSKGDLGLIKALNNLLATDLVVNDKRLDDIVSQMGNKKTLISLALWDSLNNKN